MTQAIEFNDPAALADLQTLLGRLQTAGADRVWLRTVTTPKHTLGINLLCALVYPQSLLDNSLTIFASKTLPLATQNASITAVYEIAALNDRLARITKNPLALAAGLKLPPVTLNASWAGIAPPNTGWQKHATVDTASLQKVAQQVAQQVTAALPENPGQAVVQKVRTQIWAQQMLENLPAGAAFVLENLGFLADTERVNWLQAPGWALLQAAHGQVLIRFNSFGTAK